MSAQTIKNKERYITKNYTVELSIEVLHGELLFIEVNETDANVKCITKRNIIRRVEIWFDLH